MAAMKKVIPRQGKATQAQSDFMVDYMVQNPHVATGKFMAMNGRDRLRGSWEELVGQLNGLGRDNCPKDIKSWKATWHDRKTAVSAKIAKIRRARSQTGNNEGPSISLTPRDLEILGIRGKEYAEGVLYPDSFLEEIPDAIERLVAGEDLDLASAEPLITLSKENQEDDVEYTDYEMILDMEEAGDPEGEVAANATEEAVPALVTEAAVVEDPVRQLAGRARVPQSRARGNLSRQSENAREQFAALAERQISCMEMLATAMQQIAENNRETNEILKTLVETQREQQRTLHLLLQAHLDEPQQQ